MNERERKEIQILSAALECLSAAERSKYLDQTCEGDLALRQKLEALLEIQGKADEFFGTEITDRNRAILSSPGAAAGSADTIAFAGISEKPGEMIGRYKLLQKIGEGGCGVVYMAQQEQPVRRRVALKIIKLGMDTKSVIARFEAERQALALMDHPNIAKVHDAGATETGRPYFVMELVRGVRITDYCDEQNLSTQERLGLFSQVCHAIQHAHQKGIIHRDIKPSNILVSVNDGVPIPKVIDFGIAKATTDVRLTDKTLFTAFEQFIGTPAYMSPEQAEITNVDIDTRSDIYSLGVLLYELLTGRTPFDAKELLKVGLDEMRRTIREVEPVKPSTRLSQSSGARSLSSPATRHPPLATDLDWIVMKCLEKDRAGRYETANGLAMDIQRHLSNEPVVACPPSAVYRLQKMVRRNRVAFAAGSAVICSLVLGLGLAAWMFVRERTAKREQVTLRQQAEANAQRALEKEEQARIEASRSEQVGGLIWTLLQGVAPSVAQGRDTTILRELLDNAAKQIDMEVTNEPAVECTLRQMVGQAYTAIGQYQKAEAMEWRALGIATNVYGYENGSVGLGFGRLADVYSEEQRFVEAEAAIRQAVAIFKKVNGDGHASVAGALTRLSTILHYQGKEEDAEGPAREALTIDRKRNDLGLPRSLNNLANILRELGRPEEAEQMLREAISMKRERGIPEDHPDMAAHFSSLALALERQGKLAEAEESYRRFVTISRRVYGDRPEAMVGRLDMLLRLVRKEGKNEEFEGLRREALADLQAAATTLAARNQPDNAALLRSRGEVLARLGRWREAKVDLARARELRPQDQLNWHYLAAVLLQSGDLDGFREHSHNALERFNGTSDPRSALRLAQDYLALPAPGADFSAVARMVDSTFARGVRGRNLQSHRFCRGLAEYRQERFSEAATWMREFLSDPGSTKQPSSSGLSSADSVELEVAAQATLAMVSYRLNQDGEARAGLEKSLRLAEHNLPQPGIADLGEGWVDWVMAQAILHEAAQLIGGKASIEPGQTSESKGHASGEPKPAVLSRRAGVPDQSAADDAPKSQ